MKQPCQRDCPNRSPTCRKDCEAYKEYRKFKEAEYESRRKEQIVRDFQVEGASKYKQYIQKRGIKY